MEYVLVTLCPSDSNASDAGVSVEIAEFLISFRSWLVLLDQRLDRWVELALLGEDEAALTGTDGRVLLPGTSGS